MYCILLTFILIPVTRAAITPSKEPMRGGLFTFQNKTLLDDCISGEHLGTYDKTCAPYMSSQMEAVVVAVLQVCGLCVCIVCDVDKSKTIVR